MTTKQTTVRAQNDASQPDDDALAEVRARITKENEQGYVGVVPDQTPNSAYSLASGPDGPPLVPDNRTRVEQHAAPELEG